MKESKNKKRDVQIIGKIIRLQDELYQGIHRYKVTQAVDLANIDTLVRRGLIHIVGDIFERTKELSKDTVNRVAFDRDLIRLFRNALTHNYGTISNVEAYTFIIHCSSKDMRLKIKLLSKELQEELNSVATVESSVIIETEMSSDQVFGDEHDGQR